MQTDSRQLAAFAAVLREGSFEAAARALHVTPSAISQRVKALEERLGRVLIRRGIPARPTEAGEALERLAHQLALLEQEALARFGPATQGASPLPVAIAVNADSLATWFPPALASAGHDQLLFDLHVEDQDHSSALLRQGRVMAAVTADPRAVQGCRIEGLGRMRYLAVASPEFVARHFPSGVDEASLAAAPMCIFNAKDQLQSRFLRRLARRSIVPPAHRIPSTHGFIHAALLGLGWGMNPQMLVEPLLASGALVEIAPGNELDVPLFWQTWRIESAVMASLSAAVREAAQHALVR
jgi:LysR family transcriptional regulator (chromosome initiation inhibitor)